MISGIDSIFTLLWTLVDLRLLLWRLLIQVSPWWYYLLGPKRLVLCEGEGGQYLETALLMFYRLVVSAVTLQIHLNRVIENLFLTAPEVVKFSNIQQPQ